MSSPQPRLLSAGLNLQLRFLMVIQRPSSIVFFFK